MIFSLVVQRLSSSRSETETTNYTVKKIFLNSFFLLPIWDETREKDGETNSPPGIMCGLSHFPYNELPDSVAGVTVPPPATLSLLCCWEETETMTSRFHWLQLLRMLRSASHLKDEFGGDVLSLFHLADASKSTFYRKMTPVSGRRFEGW